ncbi:hypothetical protein EPN81_01620 [Patescibacteria group bacterium]|nr:MAG: hypothetical protein EPN81_01620 [Patescibacteria group bacterium]
MNMEDKIIEKLVEMDRKIEDIRSEMATKADFNELKTVLDNQGQILQRLDQERIFTLERIKRIEADVEKMKIVLHIA